MTVQHKNDVTEPRELSVAEQNHQRDLAKLQRDMTSDNPHERAAAQMLREQNLKHIDNMMQGPLGPSLRDVRPANPARLHTVDSFAKEWGYELARNQLDICLCGKYDDKKPLSANSLAAHGVLAQESVTDSVNKQMASLRDDVVSGKLTSFKPGR